MIAGAWKEEEPKLYTCNEEEVIDLQEGAWRRFTPDISSADSQQNLCPV